MTNRTGPAIAVIMALVAGSTAASRRPEPAHATARQDPVASMSVMDALELYELGDPEVIKLVATPRQIESIESELLKGAGAWIKANGPTEAPRRRLVAATFALEAARHGLETIDGWRSWNLIDWASTELRVDRTPQPGERLWRAAVIAMLADWVADFSVSSNNSKQLAARTPLTMFTAHVSLAEQRFPGDPQWIMARAFVAELFAIQAHLRRPSLDISVSIPNDVVRLYEAALKWPAVQAEAHLRLAYLHLVGGNADRAVDHAALAATLTKESDVRCLGNLFRGWAFTRIGRLEDAKSAFALAHEAMPEGQTAALWLADRLFLDGHRDEAVAIVDRSLETAIDMDPWNLYYRGPFRQWQALIQQLRGALR